MYSIEFVSNIGSFLEEQHHVLKISDYETAFAVWNSLNRDDLVALRTMRPVKPVPPSKIEEVMKSYCVQEILKKYDINHMGLWEIKAADQNPDLGGFHYQESLGVFKGTLKQIIEKSSKMAACYGWGGWDGSIIPIEVKNI